MGRWGFDLRRLIGESVSGFIGESESRNFGSSVSSLKTGVNNIFDIHEYKDSNHSSLRDLQGHTL